jgi:hypothetical protein
MPLIAYQRAHGGNDFPLHYAMLAAMDDRGLLDRYDFAIDPSLDLPYCLALTQRFPQLRLTTSVSGAARLTGFLQRHGLRGSRYAVHADNRFDAVCEAPGGRIHPHYSHGNSIFWAYPRTQRRAILFHSIEPGVLAQPRVRESIASCELVIVRTEESAETALATGLAPSRVVRASDIVFRTDLTGNAHRPGLAVALRVPDEHAPESYRSELVRIMDYLETLNTPIDHARIEHQLGAEQIRRGYGALSVPNVQLWYGDFLYVPFRAPRDAVISCRLHTTILALLAGNRAIMQFQVEPGTSKLQQIFNDLGLSALPVRSKDTLTLDNLREFLSNPTLVPETAAQQAIATARRKVEAGLDRLEEWLATI